MKTAMGLTLFVAGARATLRVDGETLGEATIPRLLGMLSNTGIDLGRSLAPVNDDYSAPFEYPGRISSVVFELPERRGESPGEARAQARAAMSRQ